MPIEYSLSTNALTEPPSFSPRVVTKNTILLSEHAARLAERTSQTPEAIQAVLAALAEEIQAALLNGDAVVWENVLQFVPTLSGRVDSATGDLPADSVAGISVRASGEFLAGFKTQARFVRIAADSIAPEVLEVAGVNSNLQALRERDLVELKGNRMSFDPDKADEGVFFVPGNGTPALRATVYLDTGDRLARLQAPAGLVSGLAYHLRLDARRRAGALLRTFTWPVSVKAA